MAWLGKLLGGTLGFMFGGPLGMIAGIAFGHIIDRADELGREDSRHIPYARSGRARNTESTQMMFFVGAFSMIARVAQADGEVTQSERDAIDRFIDDRLRLGPQEHAAAMRVFDAALTGGGTFEQFAAQFYENFSSSPGILETMIEFFYQVSAADGQVNKREEEMIRRGAAIFHVPPYFVDSLCKKYGGCSSILDHAYAVLNITASSTDEEVKRAYHRMILEYHPDTLAAKGMGEEFKAAAEAKFREIQKAYDAIRKARGIS